MLQTTHRYFAVLASAGLLFIFALGSACSDSEAQAECADEFDCDFGEVCDVDRGECVPVDQGRAEPECTSHEGCALDEVCNRDKGKCEPASSTTPEDAYDPPPESPDAGSEDTSEPQPDPNICDPACGAGQRCEDGVCVDDEPADPTVCDPACGPGQHCEDNQCVDDEVEIEDCSSPGQACDPAEREQGAYWCISDGGAQGVCYSRCPSENRPDNCSRGELCVDLGSGAQQMLGCEASQCTSSADCPGDDVCQQRENEYGECVTPGQGGEDGEQCDVTAGVNSCSNGLICVEESPGVAFCRGTCPLWTSGVCSQNQV